MEESKQPSTRSLPVVPCSGAGLYELLQLRPLIGTRWSHFKRGTYQIMGFSLCAKDLAPLVTYAIMSPAGFISYTRTWQEFCEYLNDHSWTDDDGTERRYTGYRYVQIETPGLKPPAAVS